MEKKEVLRKSVQGMFLAKELYDVTEFEGMADTYSKNVSRVWVEIAIAMSNTKSTGLDDTELKIVEIFKNTKYTDTKAILENVSNLKKSKFNIMNILGI